MTMRTPKSTRTPNSTVDPEDRLAKRLAEITAKSPARAALFRSVYYGTPSKALAVKAKCLDCCCWETVEIKNCQTVTCPLWRVRPYQEGPPCQTQARGKRFCEETSLRGVEIAEVP
jgi:hypothetical protein